MRAMRWLVPALAVVLAIVILSAAAVWLVATPYLRGG